MSELYEKPLEAAEAKRLDDTLRGQAIPDAGLGIEFLDGYLTALICSPVEVDEAEWIEAYMGKALDEMPEDALDDLLGLITRLWNQIDTSLDLGGVEPMIDLDAELPASRWCQGFLAATNLATESWQGLARSQYSALLEPIVVLATARDEAEGEAEQDTLGKRARAVDDLADSVQALYDLWRAPMEPVRVDPRPGRNDPCPCGSGKKYKQCCGKDA